MHHRQRQQAVGAGPNRYPLIGDGRVTGSDRIDRDEFRAAFLQFVEADLHRVRRVVFGHAPQHKILRPIPIDCTEFPERIADGIKAGSGHVHRAKSAVRGPIGCAELLRPQTGQRLHLVAPGKERELFWIRRANVCEPFGQHCQRLVPRDRYKLSGAAFSTGLAHHRPGQPGL